LSNILQRRIRNFFLFSRLHTVIGTIVSIKSLYLIALSFHEDEQWHIQHLILTLIACLGANIYIVGLNQLTDIGIDRINKPYLPLASGTYSVSLAKWIIIISLLISISIGIYYSGFLLATILISLFLGTIYSLPPFRLKRFYFWAAFCIIVIRGLVVNFGLFLHFNMVLNQSKTIPPVIWMLAGSIFVMSMIIAWFKDIPDMEGDRSYRISTLSIKLGAQAVFLFGNIVLILLYASIIIFAYQFPQYWNSKVLMMAHGIFIIALLVVSSRIKPATKQSMSIYYQFIWLLFFLEYIAFAVSHFGFAQSN